MVVSDFLGNLEEVLHILFRSANKHAMAQIEDMPGALGLLHGVDDALSNGLLGAKEDARINVALRRTGMASAQYESQPMLVRCGLAKAWEAACQGLAIFATGDCSSDGHTGCAEGMQEHKHIAFSRRR